MRVLIIDDQKLFAEAIRSALSSNGHGLEALPVASTAEEGLAAAKAERPDIVLVDMVLPDGNGIELGEQILDSCPGTVVVAVTALSDPRMLRDAIKVGFHGYLTKDTPIARFIESIKSAINGQVVLPHRLAARAAGQQSTEERDAGLLADQLTDRERDVLKLLVKGARSEDIARWLSISPNTVRTHIQNILTKLQVHSRLEAAAFAVRFGLVDGARDRLVAAGSL
jgi:two-component system nitrate/nitrite response regulator NarL